MKKDTKGLEAESKRRKHKADLQKLVLQSVAAAGLLAVAVIAPNVIGALGKLGFIPNRRQRDSIQVARDRLVEQGFLTYEGNKLRLTQKGKEKLRATVLRDYRIPPPRLWDERWRVLIFDIPEKRKGLREKIRATLVAVGFTRLQDSVWIYPYPCEDLITLLKADFKIGRDLRYMIVDTLEYDGAYRTLFGLNRARL